VLTKAEPLFKREAGQHFSQPSICTCTWFSGDCIAAAEAHLAARLRLVLDANPWVAGKFQKLKGSGKKRKLHLVHPVNGSDVKVESILEVRTTLVEGLTMNTPYAETVKLCEPLTCGKTGKAMLKARRPVSKLLLAPAEGGFVMVFSMSHAVADGFTYYEILNMLGEGDEVPIKALRFTRKMEYQDHHEKRLMGARDHNYLTSGAFIKAMVGGALFGKTTAKGLKSCTPIAYHVDAEKVEAAKAEAKGVPFVSTNDVITSHFLRACRVRMAFMTINYRHPKRWAEIGDGMDAGNYEGCLLSDPAGHETPAAVREALSPNKDGAFSGIAPTAKLPGLCGSATWAFITSWASLGSSGAPFDLSCGGAAKQTLHLPIMFMDFKTCPMDVAVVFRAQPTRLAVLYLAKRAGPHELREEGSILGASVSEGMFPQG